jgi:hypothetical protein
LANFGETRQSFGDVGADSAVGDGGVEVVDEMFPYRCDRGRGVVLDHGVDVVVESVEDS